MKGIIFDFNGTMFFDGDKHENAWKKYIGHIINREISDMEFKKFVHGRTSGQIIEHFIEEKLDKETVIKMSEEKEAVYRKLCLEDKENFHLVDGLEDFLDYLKDEGYKLNIATAANKANIDFYYDKFGIGKWFDYDKVIYDDGTMPGKPDPTLFLKAAEEIEVKPEEALIFEDAISGVKAAHNGNFAGVVVISRDGNNDVFKGIDYINKIIPDYKNAKEVIEILNKKS